MHACRAVASSLAEVCRRLGLPWAAVAFLHASLGAAVRVQYAAVVESRLESLQRQRLQATGLPCSLLSYLRRGGTRMIRSRKGIEQQGT